MTMTLFDDKFTDAVSKGSIRELKKIIPKQENLKDRFSSNLAIIITIRKYELRTFKFLLKNIF